jgi:hypothetical protein
VVVALVIPFVRGTAAWVYAARLRAPRTGDGACGSQDENRRPNGLPAAVVSQRSEGIAQTGVVLAHRPANARGAGMTGEA